MHYTPTKPKQKSAAKKTLHPGLSHALPEIPRDRRLLSRRLLVVGFGAALFLLTFLVGNAFIRPDRAVALTDLGLDFLPFYSAGQFVREGTPEKIYDLSAIYAAEHSTAAANHLALDNRAGGPFWNPPFYAWMFEPFAALPFPTALFIWTVIGLIALILSIRLLRHMLPQGTPAHIQFLVPLLLLTSMPFIQALSHGQNTFISLLILCATVTAWRQKRGLAAGLLCGLLFYKPQLATVTAIVLALDLGWAAAIGTAAVGTALAAVSIFTLRPPASSVLDWPRIDLWFGPTLSRSALFDYAARLPGILQKLQDQQLYAWERHPTLRSLARIAVQGTSIGPIHLTTALIASGMGVLLAIGLIAAARRSRPQGIDDCWTGLTRAVRRDRLIAATICCTPLLAPFYFDYDLLLLAIPATLFAAERLATARGQVDSLADKWSVRAWLILAPLLMINIAASRFTGINLAALVLLIEGTAITLRACRRVTPIEQLAHAIDRTPQRRAA